MEQQNHSSESRRDESTQSVRHVSRKAVVRLTEVL